MPTPGPHTAAHTRPAALLLRVLLLWLGVVLGSNGAPELAARTAEAALERAPTTAVALAVDRDRGPDLHQDPGEAPPAAPHPPPLHEELEPEPELELDAEDTGPPLAWSQPRLRALCAGGPRGPPACLVHGDPTPALRPDRRSSGPRGPPVS